MIADELNSLFEAKNLTPRQIARMSGIAESTISRILKKQTADPSFETVVNLVKAVDGSLDEMVGITPPADPVTALKVNYEQLLAVKDEQIADKDKQIADKEAQLAVREKRITTLMWILVGLCVFVLAIVALFVYDFMHLDRGWIQQAIDRLWEGMM